MALPKKNFSFVEPIALPYTPREAPRRRQQPNRTVQHVTKSVLDGFTLIRSARVNDPREVHEANISNMGLTSANQEDLAFFTNLAAVDADDNQLPLSALAALPLLELRMRCNSLRDLSFAPGGFASLQVLDISFNRVNPDTIAGLAAAQNLKELSLASNHLRRLPDGIAKLSTLRVLDLEGNSISCKHSIECLASLPRLQTLNLSANNIEKWHAGPVGGFRCLKELDLSRNCLEHVPQLAGNLTRALVPLLQHLSVWGNPLCDGLSSAELNVLTKELSVNTTVEVIDPAAAPPPSTVMPTPRGSSSPRELAAPQGRFSPECSPYEIEPELPRSTSGRDFLPQLCNPNVLGEFKPSASAPETLAPSHLRVGQRGGKSVFRELKATLANSASSAACYTGRRTPAYMKPKRVPVGQYVAVSNPDCRAELRHDNGRQRVMERGSR